LTKTTKAHKLLKQNPIPYVPNTGIKYPLDLPDAHIEKPDMLVPPLKLDEHFPYLDTSLKFKFKSTLLYFVIFTLIFFIQPIRFGLRIEGKNNLRKYRKALKNGAISISNHIHSWDFLCVLQALKYRKIYVPAWADNFHGKDRDLIRNAGGIPIPNSPHGAAAFMRALDKLHEQKQWLHIFPESSKWSYFQPVRPFKRGAFVFSHRYNLPVIPMAFSYREAKGIYKLFKKNKALITLRIGAPIFPDKSLPVRQAVNAMRKECHKAVCDLAGITNNPYSAEGD
jgi:1-acyl-sn-glycerol-3-phosphate acyltransferase